MSFDDDGEKIDQIWFGLAFKCTHKQQREIVCRVRSTDVYKRWSALESLIKTQHACADKNEEMFMIQFDAAQSTARELAREEIALTLESAKIIDQVLNA